MRLPLRVQINAAVDESNLEDLPALAELVAHVQAIGRDRLPVHVIGGRTAVEMRRALAFEYAEAYLVLLTKMPDELAGEVAIAWTLRHPAVTAAIVGMRSAEQTAGVIGALEFRLTEAEIAEIDALREQAAAR